MLISFLFIYFFLKRDQLYNLNLTFILQQYQMIYQNSTDSMYIYVCSIILKLIACCCCLMKKRNFVYDKLKEEREETMPGRGDVV